MRLNRDAYQAWLLGEALLLALLGGALALFLTHSQPHSAYALPHLKLVLQTAGFMVLAALVGSSRCSQESASRPNGGGSTSSSASASSSRRHRR